MWKNLLANLLVGIIMVQSSVPTAVSRLDLKQNYSPVSEDDPVKTSSAAMKVSIRAVGKPTITFKTQNGRRIEQNPPENRPVPHLVLKRNGFLTPGYERTLHITVSDLDIPASGAFVVLSIETQHGDPDLGGGEGNRIMVWQDAIELAEIGESPFLKFAVLLDEYTFFQGRTIPTPTDYFRTRVVVIDLEGKQLAEAITDFAFLMENQWQVPFPELAEETPGAAPNRLAIYFCDMFPFVVNPISPDGRLQRGDVERYIQVELIPEMVEAVRTQTNLWGYPWYAEWANHRDGEDPKILSVALTNGDTWYHGPAPSRGHAEISIRVDGSMMEYETLTDGIMSTFHHELFHNLQRNISLHFGGHADIDGAEDTWETVSEGTAVLASSVGQPVVQFERSLGWRSYINRAKGFIGDEGATGGDLNQSYEKITYHSAIYWRFLYEQCGGMRIGNEDPAAGMKVIRAVLETLYKAEVADVRRDPNIVEELPRLMDRVFEQVDSCPFVNYADSLEHFAHAIYKLKLENGRCFKPDIPRECGFYDPNGLYPLPPVQIVNLTSAPQPISAEIASSYGIDFVEVLVGSDMNGRSLNIEFKNTPDAHTRFSVQVLEIQLLDDDPQQPAYMVQYGQSAVLTEKTSSGSLVYRIDGTDLDNVDCIGLIVTRLDGNERSEAGEYELTFQVH
jgi:hypothetical protein